MSGTNVNGFLGGSPVRVIVQLVVLSLIVGFVLSYFDLTPLDLLDVIKRNVIRLWRTGFDALGEIGNWLLVGAVVVVPIFLVTRLFASRR